MEELDKTIDSDESNLASSESKGNSMKFLLGNSRPIETVRDSEMTSGTE